MKYIKFLKRKRYVEEKLSKLILDWNVYTPTELIEQITFHIPAKNITSRSNIAIYPIKTGEFYFTLVLWLMDLLKNEIVDEQLRFEHIYNNMLYGIYTLKDAVDFVKDINPEIPESMFLKEDNVNMKFDVVIGNPPYQNESETTQDPLWPKFMNLSNKATKPGGYTALIVPKNWLNAPIFTTNNRKGSDLERTRMLNIAPYNMVYLAIDTPKKYFNVGSDFTYYVIHKVEHDGTKTQIEYLDNGEIKRNEIQTNDYDKIPHNLNKNTLSIIDKVFDEKLEKLEGDVTANPLGFAGSGHLKKEPDSVYCFKNVSTSSHYKNGKFFYSKIEHPNANRKKIIFSVSGYANPFFDNGELGTCHHGRSILVKDEIEANKYIKYLNSKLVTFLSSVYPSSHLAVGLVKIVDKLPKIDTSIEMSDENIYNYFNLTQEEIDYIEANI